LTVCCFHPSVPARPALARRVDAPCISEAASLDADLGATSLDMVETIMSLEDEFNIEISDRDAETLQTVGDLIALVSVKMH